MSRRLSEVIHAPTVVVEVPFGFSTFDMHLWRRGPGAACYTTREARGAYAVCMVEESLLRGQNVVLIETDD
jgi:hypothetical protein